MRDPDRTVGLVDVLAAGAGRAIGIHLQVGRVDLDLNGVIHHRIDPDAGKTGLPPGVGIERADADKPMNAAFGLQPAIGIRARDLQRRRLDPGLLAFALFDELHLVTVRFRPAHIHAHQHLRPILRFRSAGAGVQFDIAVVGVSLARQQAFDLAPLGLLGAGPQAGHGIGDHRRIALSFRHRDQFQGIGDISLQLDDAFHRGGDLVPFAHHLLCGGGVVPQRRIFGAVVQFRQAAFGDIPVKDASSAVPRTA